MHWQCRAKETKSPAAEKGTKRLAAEKGAKKPAAAQRDFNKPVSKNMASPNSSVKNNSYSKGGKL